MKIAGANTFENNAYVWVVFSKNGDLSSQAKTIDGATNGLISGAIDATEKFTGKYGQNIDLTTSIDGQLRRVIVVGTGDKLTDVKSRELGGTLHALLTKGGDTAVSVDSLGNDELSESFVQGLRLKQYDFDKYKTKKTLKNITELTVVVDDLVGASSRLNDFIAIAGGVDLTRDLTSEPANILYPATFAAEMEKMKSLGVEVEVLGEDELRKLGMNAMLGVGQGSRKDSKMVVMRYNGGVKDEAPLVLVGKGVCFDTGGISIKPSAGMEEMKWDMGGAGIVAGTMRAIAARGAKANVHAFLGLAENMPDGDAQRPGDVVTTMAGKTVEVVNTDAEGRLVLADVMTYAQKVSKPEYMIDVATLTGAIIVALGHEMAGIFSNDDDFAHDLYKSGQATGDKVWRLPVTEDYDSHINCLVADMKNVGKGRTAGSISAAKFLQQYVEDGVKWTHIDVAAMVWENAGKPLSPKGATGYGVRLLNDYINKNHENA